MALSRLRSLPDAGRGQGAVEFVYLTAVAIQHRDPPPALTLPELGAPQPVASRPVYFKELGWVETPIYRREHLGRDIELGGPLIVEEVDSTTVVLDGQIVRTHPQGSLVIVEAHALEQDELVPADLEARRA